MAYTVYGYVKLPEDCSTPPEGVKVYPYFKKVDSASPDSKWTDNPYTTDSEGYYSFDLNDADLLGSEASYKKGTDKIYIAYVYEGSGTIDSTDITHAAFYAHTTVNADDYSLDINLPVKRVPIVDSYSIVSGEILTSTNYTMSENSYIDTSWSTDDCNGNEGCYDTLVSQKNTYDLVSIFSKHSLVDTIYDWGEVDGVTVSNNSSSLYAYTIAGVYNVSIVVNEEWGTYAEISDSVTVRYNKPIPNFSWDPTYTNDWQGQRIKGQELITFSNTSFDLDDRTWDSDTWGDETYTYSWTITDELLDGTDNTDTYTDKDISFKPTKQFQSAGTKTITLNVYWNDGFDDHTETIEKTLEVYAFDIVPDISWDKVPKHRSDTVTFTDTSTGDIDKISRRDWVIIDDFPAPADSLYTFSSDEESIYGEGSSDNTQRIDNTYSLEDVDSPSVNLHSIESKDITLTVYYDNGWETVTETIVETITPTKYTTTPTIDVSTNNPLGRSTSVDIRDVTLYTYIDTNVSYNVDWDINDYYSECNLDNPSPGDITDNSVSYLAVLSSDIQTHNYQNTNNNSIELTIRYDNGYQMVTEATSIIVTPTVYSAPIPEFTWTPDIPISRDVEVIFSNTTEDINNRFRMYELNIEDEYYIYNPNNPDYANSSPDNSVHSEIMDANETVSHYFQSIIDSDITLIYHYDDGFCDRTVSVTRTIHFTNYTIYADFTTDIDTIDEGFIGAIEVGYINTTSDDNNRAIDIEWTINDRDGLNNNTDDIYVFGSMSTTDTLNYTYKYVSRVPYSAENSNSTQNINKDVTMKVRYDNGWSDQEFTDTTKYYEASPYEVDANITYETNINNEVH